MKKIAIIVVIAEHNAIGKENRLLCHLPADLKHFKRLTSGHTVVMGKRTYESLPFRPLKNRRNIVISDNPNEQIPGCEMAYSIPEAIEKMDDDKENFIIGGGSVYRQFLPLATKLYITRIKYTFDADTFFPEIDFDEWHLVDKQENEPDENNPYAYDFITYKRKRFLHHGKQKL
ncbi:MAG: dihydrofolate reductase [Bacteroidales bacterium]|nr:dihydrofolate reductase [Lentimicrobiaceae bacterium]MDD5695642.1 dihydrofolate reductase [Bacteroidales bacterium]